MEGRPRAGRTAPEDDEEADGSSSSTVAAACARTSGPPDEKDHIASPVARSTACTVPSRRETSRGDRDPSRGADDDDDDVLS